MVAFVRLRWIYAAAVVVHLLLYAVIGGAWYLLRQDRQASYQTVATAQDNVTLGLERDILRNIDIYDLSLRAAAFHLSLLGGITDSGARNALLFDSASFAHDFRPIVIVDATGTVVLDAAAAAPRVVSIAGRYAFEMHRANDHLGLMLYLAEHSVFDNKAYFQITRRIRAPEGGFGGIVLGGIDLGYFNNAFSRLTLPPGGVIALVGFDGRVVAEVPARGAPGRMLNNGDISAEMRALADGHGSFESPGGGSDIPRVVTVRRLGTLPFFLRVGTPQSAVYAEWRFRAWGAGLGVVLVVVVSSLLAFGLKQELKRRKKAEAKAVAASAAARAGEARLNTYVDHLADGILALRRRGDGRFAYERINAAAADMLGLDPVLAVGQSAEEIWSVPLGEMVQTQWGSGSAEVLRFERVHEAGGVRRVLRIAVAPVKEPQPDGTETVTLLLANLRDVTATADLERRLLQAQRMEAVGQLTAGVAHDFNNMLQAQMGALELLLDEVADTPRAAELAQMALNAGSHGSRLTHSLLSFSRQQHLAPRPVLAGALLDRLGQMLAHTLGPKIQLEVTAQDGMAALFADAAQLEAALLNLASNARDAMPDGGQLRIEARDATPDDAPRGETASSSAVQGRCVLLAVSDTGQGMNPDVVARACEPFFTTKGVGKGSGLGLSMVQGFTQQSGGVLRILSTPGKGTRVELWLPAAPASNPEPAPAAAEPGPVFGTGRVLLVDDNPDVLAVTAEILEGAGFMVVPAANGEEALALLRSEQPFDILVTDYMMPGLDGGRLVAQACSCCPGLASLVITGHTETGALGELSPDVVVMHKPVRGAVLVRQITDIIAARHPSARVPALSSAAFR